MNNTKFYLPFLLFIFSFNTLYADININHGITLGNDINSVLSASGKNSVIVNMTACRFKISLKKNQHLIFNAPEVIFYESKTAIKKNNLPYLWQAEMSVGYAWAFKKKAGLHEKWFGLMCENSDNFSWTSKKTKEVSLEHEQIKNSNDLKCPASIKDGKWQLNSQKIASNNYLFKELKGANWSGFIVGYKNDKLKSTLDTLRFCLMHGNKVIVGASENYTKSLFLPISFFDTIQQPISTIEFVDS